MPEWRNGRRRGLKILGSKDRAGSSPALGTIAPLAQLVEHQAFNLLVVGSSPTGCTIALKTCCYMEPTTERKQHDLERQA